MLIDDDEDDIIIFCQALFEVDSNLGCLYENDSRKALQKILSEKAPPDLVFIDINMPNLNGWEVLTMLRSNEKAKGVPVIIYSTSKNSHDLQRAKREGALCYFVKPKDYNSLKDGLKSIITMFRENTLKDAALIECGDK